MLAGGKGQPVKIGPAWWGCVGAMVCATVALDSEVQSKVWDPLFLNQNNASLGISLQHHQQRAKTRGTTKSKASIWKTAFSVH